MRVTLLTLPLCFIATMAIAGEPPRADLSDPDEPPPAPLKVEAADSVPAVPKPIAAAPAPVEVRRRALLAEPASDRSYRIAAWSGVGITLAFVVSGTVLGVLAQRDSDELVRLASERVEGRPLPYDAERQARYMSLYGEGAAFNRATIACFVTAGISAIASGLLFWDASRRVAEQKKGLALRPSVSTGTGEARLLLGGRF